MTMDTICIEESPPVSRRPIASSEIKSPHMVFRKEEGSKLPSELKIPKTSVPESADVMKKANSSTMARIDRSELMGYCPSTANSAISGVFTIEARTSGKIVP